MAPSSTAIKNRVFCSWSSPGAETEKTLNLGKSPSRCGNFTSFSRFRFDSEPAPAHITHCYPASIIVSPAVPVSGIVIAKIMLNIGIS